MSDDVTSGKSEIVIVRRRGGDDAAGGKGGAWKIAYADFVTAMMAFFLVMWLINASNEETRAQVASYFNPIKLTDNSTGKRGLRERKEGKGNSDGEAEASAGGTPPAAADARHESELMADPDKALERVEAALPKVPETGAGTNAAMEEEAGSSRPREQLPGVGDPFDPRSWEKAAPATVPESHDVPPGHSATPEKSDAPSADSSSPSESNTPPQALPPAATEDAPVEAKVEQPGGKTEEAPAPVTDDGKEAQRKEAAEVAAEIARELGTGLDDLPASIEVRTSDEGMLISLTDRQSFSMFRTGSAEPEPELVRLVEAISRVLQKREGYVVVRGHTDARPYRNKKYDNWQLSTARAHFAQYMLLRGGLDEKRIRRVEGLADREPRIADDPQAPENRRIEVLLGREPP